MTLNDIQSTLQDNKQHMHWLYELMRTCVKEGRVGSTDVKYLANQMGCHESRIDDNDRDSGDLMGTIDFIKEEVQKLTSMNHYSHCQETPSKYHPIEENLVVHPFHGLGENKKQ